MAYFLPSYFQKRLLRYALTRLDFIETDALNLEDLDLSLGQRTVVELKNVGIKVNKLVEKLQIPPSVLLSRASVRYLRITVPADLHISGIAVELDGIDVQVDLQEDDVTKRRDTASAPTRADAANKPRIASPHIHDPGGNWTSTARTSSDDHQHVIPTSQDLAMSFLESEPRREREELEAAIQSQSQHISESTGSLHRSFLDESGIGMPGGFSLPSFVAKFFSGVADRLSITIKNVTASVAMKLNAENATAETLRILVKLGTISLDGLQSELNLEYQRSQRSVIIGGLEILLLSEAEAFSRSSATSSPKLARSHSKLSSISDDNQFSPSYSPLHHDLTSSSFFQNTFRDRSSSPAEVSSDESTTSSQPADLSGNVPDTIHKASSPVQAKSTHGEVNTHRQASDSSRGESDANIDNQKYAESLVGSSYAMQRSSGHVRNLIDSDEDLSQSKMFTHDQAESMYMSAVSEAIDMPGAWDRPVFDDNTQNLVERASPEVETPPADTPASTSSSPRSSHAQHGTGEDIFPLDSKNQEQTSLQFNYSMLGLVAKQLIHVDQVSISFPSTLSKTDPAQIIPQSSSIYTRVTNATSSVRSIAPGRAALPSGHIRAGSHDFMVSSDFEFTIVIGNVSLNLDMAVTRILLAAASQTNKYLPHGQQQPSKTSNTDLSSSFTVGNLSINLCQSVPEVATDKLLEFDSQGSERVNVMNSCLLQFTLSNLTHEIAMAANSKRQKLQIQHIVLGHATQRYMYFVDSFGLHTSVASSRVLRPHDLLMTNQDDRFEVQIKPIHAVIDLMKVDDILCRSGGLSSILDLGNSILSTGTVTEKTPKSSSPARQRAVRFNTPSTESQVGSENSVPGLKIDVRISGALIDLIGSECSVQVRSSAVKVVSRTGSLRAQIDTVVLAGPVVSKSKTKPGVSVRLGNIGVHFKDSPEEQDLDRLLSLLTPSHDKYDDEDDIMVDTLIRQRRKGAVMGVKVNDVKVDITGIAWLEHVTRLGDELSKLATVTKYLPEDDRPGILIFGLISTFAINADFGGPFGILHVNAKFVEGANISVPSLMAAQVNNVSIKRGGDSLLGDVIPESQDKTLMGPPMLMCRFIADEMEPTIRIKLSNACFEYTIPTMTAITDLIEHIEKDEKTEATTFERSSDISTSPSDKTDFVRKVQLSLVVRDSAIALNPDRSTARGLVLLSDAILAQSSKKSSTNIQLDLKKASILIIDDIARLGHESTNVDHKLYFEENDQVQELTKAGYVPVGSISNASANVSLTDNKATSESSIDVEFRNNLFLLETCADSTQTLIQILSNLTPPSPPSQTAKYRTEVVPIQDMLASFTGNAFVSEPGPELGLQASQVSHSTAASDDYDDDEDDDGSEVGINEMYEQDDDRDRMTESYLESEMSQSRMTGSLHIGPVNPTASPDPPMGQSIMAHSMLDFRTDHFVQKSSVGGTAHRWNSAENTYGLGSENSSHHSPLKVRIRDVHIIWNLFDGYDWQNTRDTISQAVKDIETKAMTRKPRRRDSRMSPGAEDDESVIGDFLFNSIYIGIPANKDPRELANAINQDLGDMASETGSYATGTTVTASPSGRIASSRSKPKRLRLNRSKQHKMTFELKGLSADVIAFPPGTGEIESSVDVRVKMLEIFDHVPTSTWKKFVTYMHEAGEREIDTNMIHLELLNVKPVAELSASEIVMKLTVLPLRLHIDQDALDFLTRFFEFKDERAPISTSPSAPPFIQRAEVNPVRLRLDFKPKRVDYGGLRSGRTTEFMNFFVLDKTDIVLRRIILYGVSGFDRLGITLNNIWTPDVKKNQLPTVLSGLAPIRSLVDVGSGVRDLVAVPIREYKKDGRIVRSIQKGAIAFAKTTTTELVNLGAKLAIGTQTVLQNAEDVLVPRDRDKDDEAEKELISLYADQPIGIVQGLRTAYASLERDLLLAKDAIVAIPGEVIASGSATGAAKAIVRQSPTIILRPAIGASKAVGQALLGAGNTLDKGNLRRIEDKYKHH